MLFPAVISCLPLLCLLLLPYLSFGQGQIYGIELTTSYGSIVGNGDEGYVPGNKVKVYGGPEYEGLMRRLSLPSSQHFSPPYNNIFEKLVDKPRQLLRLAIKNIGLFPPTNDVRILNDFLKDLHRQILGRATGTRFDHALLSFPALPGLYEEDILDGLPAYGILPETGWLTVTPRQLYNHPHSALAAFAADGFGLCSNPTDAAACKEEESQMPEYWVYTVEYTNTSIHTRLSRMSVATLEYESYDPAHTLTSFDLGYAAFESRSDKHVYWAEVTVFLSQLPRTFQDEGPITFFSLLGDCVYKGEEFIDIAIGAVLQYQETIPYLSTADPEYAAAEGALELAKRWVARYGKGSGPLSEGQWPMTGMTLLAPP